MKWKQREILFRGLTQHDKTWRYGNLAQSSGMSWVFDYDIWATDISKIVLDNNGEGRVCHVIDETCTQYTGVEDMNGKKIFEGDIVQCYWSGDFREGHSYALVRYIFSSFALIFDPIRDVQQNGSKLDDCVPKEIKILGNVFQNPELVEKYEL